MDVPASMDGLLIPSTSMAKIKHGTQSSCASMLESRPCLFWLLISSRLANYMAQKISRLIKHLQQANLPHGPQLEAPVNKSIGYSENLHAMPMHPAPDDLIILSTSMHILKHMHQAKLLI